MPVEQEAENETPKCPKCSGDMWDNRASKRNPRAPDFKCKDRSCDGVIWPPREQGAPMGAGSTSAARGAAAAPAGDAPACPVCGGAMWDDRATKRNPRAPDFKCRDKPKFQGGPGCPGVIWPPREGESRTASTSRSAPRPAPRTAPRTDAPRSAPRANTPPPPDDDFRYREFSDDELPF